MNCCEKYGQPDEQHFHRNENGWITILCKIFITHKCDCKDIKHTRENCGKK